MDESWLSVELCSLGCFFYRSQSFCFGANRQPPFFWNDRCKSQINRCEMLSKPQIAEEEKETSQFGVQWLKLTRLAWTLPVTVKAEPIKKRSIKLISSGGNLIFALLRSFACQSWASAASRNIRLDRWRFSWFPGFAEWAELVEHFQQI